MQQAMSDPSSYISGLCCVQELRVRLVDAVQDHLGRQVRKRSKSQ